MANQQLVITSIEQLEVYRKKIVETSNKTVEKISDILSNQNSIEALKSFKFQKVGFEPIQGYELNIIEQLNQMFSHIVVFKATEILLKRYPEKIFTLNIGTTGGYDIVSLDEKVIGECFATTNPISNNKIKSDADKLLKNTDAEAKYIIYYSEEANEVTLRNLQDKYTGINFIRLEDLD